MTASGARLAEANVGIKAGAKLGPYEIVAPIGAGGMGEVYRARDTRLGREVAIKVLPETVASDGSRLRRFEREARSVAALNHPNILTIYDVGTDGDTAYLVTELLAGTPLRERLRDGAMAPNEAARLGLEIARGLAAAHEKGVVHRDLKPENLFVTSEGRLKILDFGLARQHEDAPAGGAHGQAATLVPLTEPGIVMGTVGYISPEQLRGADSDERSDLFALGVILYEMVGGRHPFLGATNAETLAAIIHEPPPPWPPAAPTPLRRVVERCLAKAPASRFQTAREVAAALEIIVAAPEGAEGGGVSVAAAPPSVAVLVFQDLAGAEDNSHLGVGLADAIITELARLRRLAVRPTAAILRYRGRSVSPEQAARELGVDAVLDGSFQRAGSRLRLTVQLVTAAEGRPLWGAKIDTTVDDVFAMQDEVSRHVAEALAIELTPAEQQPRALQKAPASGAWELLLKGRVHLLRENLEETNAAVDAFAAATRADPGFALAWAGLADAYSVLGLAFDPDGDWLAQAEAAFSRAAALAPGLPELRYLRSRLVWNARAGWDHATALREAAAAVTAQPSLNAAYHRLGTVLCHVSLLEESAACFERARRLNPDDHASLMVFAFCRFLQQRHEEAIEMARDVIRAAPSAWASYTVALCQTRLGMSGSAEETIEQASRQFPGSVLFYPLRGLIAAQRGDAAAARRQIELTMRSQRAFVHYHHAQYDVACVLTALGDHGAAVSWLSDCAHNGFPCDAVFARDAALSPLRGEPSFAALLRELASGNRRYRELWEELGVAALMRAAR